VDAALAQHRIHGSYVIQYELTPEPGRLLPAPPARSFAGVNTHDMPPFAAFWSGSDIADRQRAGHVGEDGIEEERRLREVQKANLLASLRAVGLIEEGATDVVSVYEATLRFLRGSAASYTLVNLEDIWQETKAQNLPGTTHEHANWVRRARYGIEELPDFALD
jgi:4-alpha-glucanotransferase